jgi:tRNA modification GTPase
MGVLAFLEASIDFVEEDIPEAASETLLARLGQAEEGLQALLATARHGIILREGLRAVLTGAPNVGKSSLLNRLLRADRAIVTPVAGTTRDTVEEPANIRDVPVYLVDTAGLTVTDDPVEQLGVQRSRSAIAAADLLLLVADASRPLDERDREAFSMARVLAPDTPALLVLNKADLPRVLDPAAACALFADPPPASPVTLSAATGQGLEELEEAIATVALGGATLTPDTALIDNARHRCALEEALDALRATCMGLGGGAPLDLVCSDLRAAVTALGAITGQDVTDDLLSRIFGQFCIGK